MEVGEVLSSVRDEYCEEFYKFYLHDFVRNVHKSQSKKQEQAQNEYNVSIIVHLSWKVLPGEKIHHFRYSVGKGAIRICYMQSSTQDKNIHRKKDYQQVAKKLAKKILLAKFFSYMYINYMV